MHFKNHPKDPSPASPLPSRLRSVRAGRVLTRKTWRCIECGACRRACRERHGEERWQGSWKTIGVLTVAPVCVGCAEPACLAACRRDALQATSEGVRIIREKCVSCGLCARACPFGAISHKSSTLEAAGEKTPEPNRPTKCDGCEGYRHRACVRQCPAGALRVLDWREALELERGKISPERPRRLWHRWMSPASV